MATERILWPSKGRAVNARNDTAYAQAQIIKEVQRLERLIKQGKAVNLDFVLSLSKVQRLANQSLILMIQEGAPYRQAPIV